jgi:hypothetical protein
LVAVVLEAQLVVEVAEQILYLALLLLLAVAEGEALLMIL